MTKARKQSQLTRPRRRATKNLPAPPSALEMRIPPLKHEQVGGLNRLRLDFGRRCLLLLGHCFRFTKPCYRRSMLRFSSLRFASLLFASLLFSSLRFSPLLSSQPPRRLHASHRPRCRSPHDAIHCASPIHGLQTPQTHATLKAFPSFLSCSEACSIARSLSLSLSLSPSPFG